MMAGQEVDVRAGENPCAVLERLNSHLQQQNASLVVREREALSQATLLRSVIGELNEKVAFATMELGSMREELDEKQGQLAHMNYVLVEYQHKNAEVQARIKEAMEGAQEAKLGRELVRLSCSLVPTQTGGTEQAVRIGR
eukprot:scaffold2083_cov419-Prasinococcus_capsulatus_cf.AAC.7